MSFAKIFETEKGQILVMRDTNDDGEPAIKFYAQPAGMGVCYSTLSFSDNDVGEVTRDSVFNGANLEVAERVTKVLFSFES